MSPLIDCCKLQQLKLAAEHQAGTECSHVAICFLGVLSHHPKDQFAKFLLRPPSSNLRPDSEDQPPIQTRTSPVPADDGFRHDDDGACFHPDQKRRTTTQKSLSKGPRLGRGCRRFSTASCCRTTRFSKTRFPRLRKGRSERLRDVFIHPCLKTPFFVPRHSVSCHRNNLPKMPPDSESWRITCGDRQPATR